MVNPIEVIKALRAALEEIAKGSISDPVGPVDRARAALRETPRVDPGARLITDEERRQFLVLLDALFESNGKADPAAVKCAAAVGVELEGWPTRHPPKPLDPFQHSSPIDVLLSPGGEIGKAYIANTQIHQSLVDGSSMLDDMRRMRARGGLEIRIDLVVVDRPARPDYEAYRQLAALTASEVETRADELGVPRPVPPDQVKG